MNGCSYWLISRQSKRLISLLFLCLNKPLSSEKAREEVWVRVKPSYSLT